jgi:predicted NACHT family NTPase
MVYDMGVLRQLVNAAYSDEELNNLCFDCFHPVYEQFTTGMNRSQKDRALIEYCQRQGVVDRLLGEVKKRNPVRYEEFIGSKTNFSTREQYLAQITKRYEALDFVGIPELKDRQAVGIEDVFIRLKTEVETRHAQPEVEVLLASGKDPSEFEANIRGYLGRERIKQRVSANEALGEHRRIVILGDPGAGKTTLLKYIVLAFAQGKSERLELNEECLPIFVRLHDYVAKRKERPQDYSLVDYLYTQARENLLLTLEPDFFETALEQGECCLCLDGLDELGGAGLRREVTRVVAALASRYPGNRFIVTSRVAGYNEAPLDERDFIHLTVLPFNNDDISHFVQKWYRARERDPVQAETQIKHLIKTIMDEPRIKTLAANPLLLTIIALVHRIEAELPHERVKLYEKCVTALMETWEKVKQLSVADRERPYYEYRFRLLEQVAFWLHSQSGEMSQAREISEGDLEEQLVAFLLQDPLLQLSRHKAREEAKAFIRLVQSRTGLLVERGEGVYTFAHPTFQEYLAATHIMHEHAHSIDEIWQVIQPHLQLLTGRKLFCCYLVASINLENIPQNW